MGGVIRAAIRSRQKFELLNDNLGGLLRRAVRMVVVVKINVSGLTPRSWNAGGEEMFADRLRSGASRGPAECLERSGSWLPAEHMSKDAGRRHEARNIFRDVKRLNDKLSVLACRIAPAAHLDVEFATHIVRPELIRRVHAENGGWAQVTGVPHDEGVGPITEASGETHLGA